MSELVVLATTWIFEISYRSGYVGLLVLHLLLLLIKTLAQCENVVRLSLFYRHYFGICPSKLAVLVLLLYSSGRSCRYSNRMHNVSVISTCYKDVYVSSIFSHTVRLWSSLPAKRFPSIYDLNGFNSTVKTVQTTNSIKWLLVWDDQCWVRPSKFLYNRYCIRRQPV